MNKHQASHVEMFNTVSQYMEQHRQVWERVKVVSDTVAELQDRIRLVTDKIRRQSEVTEGVLQAKDQFRLEFELSVLHMANHLAVFAAKTNNYRLAEKAHLTTSKLGTLTRDALERVGEKVHELIVEHLAALADFGIMEGDATTFASLLEKYRNVRTSTRRAISDRNAETITLPALIRGTSALLRHQLDKLMIRFRKSHVEFYVGYFSARVIINPGSRGQTPATNPKTPPAPTTPTTAAEPASGSKA